MKTIRKQFNKKEIHKFLNVLENFSLNLAIKQSAYPTKTIGEKRPYPLFASKRSKWKKKRNLKFQKLESKNYTQLPQKKLATNLKNSERLYKRIKSTIIN